jgi:dTDP-4-dehydrorhamnose reductase
MDLSNKRILVTGANGQLGSAIVSVFKLHNIDVIGTDRTMMDITNQQQVFEVIKHLKPQVIIHCAAYTAVDQAEDDKVKCYNVNVDGTRNLALIAKELKIEFVYFSTDYVFDGTKIEPYSVTDIPNPINYYGLTKYLGEEIIKSLITTHYIFRISWVFGPKGKNFVSTILRLTNKKPSINVVSDQLGSPTFTFDIANFLINSGMVNFGTHHLSNNSFISWFDFASLIIYIKQKKNLIVPILSKDFNGRVNRPMNSRLKSDLILHTDLLSSLSKYLSSIIDE